MSQCFDRFSGKSADIRRKITFRYKTSGKVKLVQYCLT